MHSINIPMKKKEYEQISELIYKKSGIFLAPHKITMIQSRLNKRLKELELNSYAEYVNYLGNDQEEEELTSFTNALTTNKTEFFRENKHFEYLKDIILKEHSKLKNFKNPFYIWSAACSTGEEVFSTAMIMEEHIRCCPKFSYRIVGSDIDTNMLHASKKGIYKVNTIKNIPPQYIQKYFSRGTKSNKSLYKIEDKLKENIKFMHYNLIEGDSNFNIKFNIIFLRNVLIYFKNHTIEKVINNISNHLLDGGILFIGHSETLHKVKHNLKSIGSATYIK